MRPSSESPILDSTGLRRVGHDDKRGGAADQDPNARALGVSRRHKYGDTSSLIADLASSDSGIVQYALPVHGLHGMLVSPARRRIGLDIEVLRLPPLSTLFALEDNQSSASARTHHTKGFELLGRIRNSSTPYADACELSRRAQSRMVVNFDTTYVADNSIMRKSSAASVCLRTQWHA